MRNFRNDLSIFLSILSKHDIGEFSSLYDLLGKLDSLDSFGYSLINIEFYLNGTIAGTIPDSLNKFKISLINTINLKDEINSDKDNISSDYLFELNIDSYGIGDGDGNKPFKSCLHHDKHIDSSEPKYTHPTYHFHFGGDYLEGLNTGDTFILSSPRIPHPPMDIFLGFHFIVSNYFSAKDYAFVNELKSSIEYQTIIKRAQERLWTPYFKAFDSTNTHQDFILSKIFPLYLS